MNHYNIDPLSTWNPITAADEALRAQSNTLAFHAADDYEELLLDWADECALLGDDDSLATLWASEVNR
jgi:hypothetical protein